MRAAWYSENGKASDVLQLGQQPTPLPAPGEVRVKLVTSGVNPSDVKSRAGGRPVRSGFIVPHSDGAGFIDKVGEGVSSNRVGERVWVWNAQWQRSMGTAAEYVALPSGQAVVLPDTTDFDAGACLGIPALTAYRAVELLGDVSGKTVLVIGAASAVGFYAVQLARLKGARVIGTVGSKQKADHAISAGADDTIDYKNESVAQRLKDLTHGRGADAVIDMDFSTTAALVPQGGVANHGRLVSYGSNFRGEVPIEFSAWLPRSLSLHFFLVYDLSDADRRTAVHGLQDLMEHDRLQHSVGKRYGLDEIVAAHEAVETGQVLGNVVLTM